MTMSPPRIRCLPKNTGVQTAFSAICSAQKAMAKALPGRTATRAAATAMRM